MWCYGKVCVWVVNKKLHGQRQAKVSVAGAASLKQDVPTKGGQGWGQDAVLEINEERWL